MGEAAGILEELALNPGVKEMSLYQSFTTKGEGKCTIYEKHVPSMRLCVGSTTTHRRCEAS